MNNNYPPFWGYPPMYPPVSHDTIDPASWEKINKIIGKALKKAAKKEEVIKKDKPKKGLARLTQLEVALILIATSPIVGPAFHFLITKLSKVSIDLVQGLLK